MDRAAVESWLERYGRAWEQLDPAAAVDLFSPDAEYLETPFDEPMRGHDAIRAYWARAAEAQRDVAFGFRLLAVEGDRAVAHWWASYVRRRDAQPTRVDGTFELLFAPDGRCRSLKEWWHAHPEPSFRASDRPATPGQATRAATSTPPVNPRLPALAALVVLAVAGAIVFLLMR